MVVGARVGRGRAVVVVRGVWGVGVRVWMEKLMLLKVLYSGSRWRQVFPAY